MDFKALKTTENRFSSITSKEARAIDELNDSLMWGAMTHLRENGFRWLEVPLMTKITGACENVDTLYAVDHFGVEAYLAQTGQLYLEAKIPVHEKVWTVITSSRAEGSVDGRHLNQFQLVEFEHQGDFRMMLGNIEGTVKAMIREALEQNPGLLKELSRYDELAKWVDQPFGEITYTQAVEAVRGTEHELEWGEDLTSKVEAELVKMNGNKPLFITHFPLAIKFFNMRQNPDEPEVVNSADLIMPYSGESVGSAERENNYENLVTRLVESPMFKTLARRGKTLEDFGDYLEIVKAFPVLHAGCGIGFNRISQAVLGEDDIRVSSNYPLQRNVLY